jgi:hypothetical protein
MTPSRVLSYVSCGFLACGAMACSSSSGGSGGSGNAPSGSEVAVSAVSGALNNTSGSALAWYPQAPKSSPVERALAFLNPIGTAQAAEWSCVSGQLSPSFSGPGADPYQYTPPSCSVTWANGRTASSSWSGAFTLSYGSSCNSANALMEKQVAGCELTRTSSASGDTRTVTGPDGYQRAVDHDTNGAGTGWDSTVTPAPNNDGVQTTCGGNGCESSRTIVLGGSHLTGTISIDGDTETIWDHTVTGQIDVSGAGASRVATGAMTVQHNLLHYTSTTTFTSVGYTQPLCCFPTSGSVSTTYTKGSETGKTEALEFTGICGESILTQADGQKVALTLEHCL